VPRVRAGKIVANLSTAALYEAAVREGEGMIAAEGRRNRLRAKMLAQAVSV